MLGFSALSLAVRAAIIGGAVLALLGGYAAWHHNVFQAGVKYEQARIERVNKRATDHARDLKSNSDACDDAGGNWRQSLGLCQ